MQCGAKTGNHMETIKKGDLYLFKEAIEEAKGLGNFDFKYRLVLVEMEVDKHLKVLQELKKEKEFSELQAGRESIIAKYAEKDETGQVILYEKPGGVGAIVEGKGFPKIVGDEKELTKEIEQYLADNKEKIDECEEAYQAWLKSLEEEVTDFNFKPIPYKLFPDGISYDSLKKLFKLIDNAES
jgi:hypothetical protein